MSSTGPLGYDAFATATALTLATGALASVVPGLNGLVAALAAVAVAAWAAGLPTHAWGRADPRRTARAAALVAAAATGVLFLDPLPGVGPARAALLGAGLVPLWWAERGPHSRSRPGPVVA